MFPGGHPSNYWSKKEKKEFAQPRSWTASPHAVTHPGTDVARSCLTSEIGLSPGEITFPEGTRIRRYLFSNIWSKRTPNAIFFSIPPDFSPLLAQFWGQMIQFFKPNPGPYYTTTCGALGHFNFNYFGPNSTRQNQFLEQFLATRILCFFQLLNWFHEKKVRNLGIFQHFWKKKIIFQSVLCFWNVNSHGNWKKVRNLGIFQHFWKKK